MKYYHLFGNISNMYVTRRNQKVIFKSFSSKFVSTLLGPRRVGKSTLVGYFISQHPQYTWVQLNMDIRAERLRVEADQLEVLLEERSRQKIDPNQPLWVVIDEAQKCPPLFEQIKVLYDRFKGTDAIKFILTGSGFLSLHRLASESLAGRIELFHLREFNLREAVALEENRNWEFPSLLDIFSQAPDPKEIENLIKEIAPHRFVLQESLKRQMIWGGLPEILEQNEEEEKIKYLGNYLQTYLEKDVRDIETITDLGLYQKMMEILAQQTGSLRDDKGLVEALQCHRDTLKKYRGYLEATLVYRELYPFIGSSLKRTAKSPKGYLTNNGLISYLMGIYDLNVLEKTGNIGHRFENWALRELLIWLDRDPKQSEIYFWRTSGKVEVDLVAQRHPQVYPFEISYSSQVDRKKVKHLKQFLREERKSSFGILIYNGEFKFDDSAKIIFLPAWALG